MDSWNSEKTKRGYHLAILVVSIVLAGLPWATVRVLDITASYAAFQVPGFATALGCALFIAGALVHRSSGLMGALMQSGGLLSFGTANDLELSIGYWLSVVFVLITWVLVLKPDLVEKFISDGSPSWPPERH